MDLNTSKLLEDGALQAMRRIIDYAWSDEANDYAETVGNPDGIRTDGVENKSGHVFEDLVIVEAHLGRHGY